MLDSILFYIKTLHNVFCNVKLQTNIWFRYNEFYSCEMSCINIRYEKSIAKMVNCMF